MRQDSPAGLWPLAESDVSSGAVIADVSGNVRNGAVVAGATVSSSVGGPLGRYMVLGGSPSYAVQFGDLTQWESASGGWAAEIWIKPTATAQAPGVPFSKYTPNVGSYTLNIGVNGTGELTDPQFYWFQQSSFNVWQYASTALNYGAGWHQVGMELDGSLNVILYVDGVEIARNSGTPTGTRATTDTSLLGLGSYGSGAFDFLGGVSHFAIFPAAIGATRFKAHYKAGLRGGVVI